MNNVLVAIFDETNEATTARSRLEAFGIPAESIRIEQNRTDSEDSAATNGEPKSRRGFFAELFGIGDDDSKDESGDYAEAVRRGSVVLTVKLADDDKRADEITDILEDCGAIDVDERVDRWKAGGYSEHDESALPLSAQQRDTERNEMLKVIAEEVKVGKREVEGGGIRVRRRVTQQPFEQEVSLREQHAVTSRVAVDRAADPQELQAAFTDRTIELRETAEEAVVSKTARVVEEVRVGTESTERKEMIRDSLRRSDVDIERIEPAPQPTQGAQGDRLNHPGIERRSGAWAAHTGAERRAGT